MKRVKIYVVECTQAYSMSEQGVGFSLRPWGDDTEYYQGDDDGGTYYDLPENYELSETKYGEPAIYRKDDDGNYCHCNIVHQDSDRGYEKEPILVSKMGISKPLDVSDNQDDDED